MPIYSLKNKDTGEIFEKMMKISDYEQYLKDNPNIERYFNSAPTYGDPVRLGITKPPSDFMKNVVGRMKASIPGNTLHDRKFNIPKEFWVVFFSINTEPANYYTVVMRVFLF